MYIHLYVMATKCITITVEAYEKLARLKKGKDSFSDVINREIGEKSSLMELAGIFGEEGGKDFEKAIKDNRKRWKRRVNFDDN